MMESENLQRLNRISSTVSERDQKIWENVAHSVLIQKETEKLKTEIVRMKTATAEKKKENKIIENQLIELTKTLTIQEETLKTSEQSVVALTAFKENLQQDANNFKKKYMMTLEMYNDEYKDYREVYENASQGYKDLTAQQTELKKLEVKKMILDSKITSLVKSQTQYKTIQEKIFYKTMVRFANFYVLYHTNARLRVEVQEKKKEEQQLLKDHLRLAELVKQKKQMYRNKPQGIPNRSFANQQEKSLGQTNESIRESKERTIDKLQKFLSEDFKPCSLTSLDSGQRAPNFNQDSRKVQILDMKTIMPPPRPILGNKSNPEVRKKMENILQAAKIEARRTNLPTPTGSPVKTQKPPSMSQQSQPRQPPTQTKIVGSQKSQSGSQNKINSRMFSRSASQENDADETQFHRSQREICEPAMKVPRMTPSGDVRGATSKDTATNSILKPSSQGNVEKPETNKPDNVSKFFNAKKKSVKFQSQVEKPLSQEGNGQFQLFAMEQKTQPGDSIKNLDIFQKPIFFKEGVQKHDKENNKNPMLSESEEETSGGIGSMSFNMDTAPTTLSTFPGKLSENKNNDLSFDLMETSFNRSFVQPAHNPAEDFAATTGTTTFDFFGSLKKTNNPFNLC